MWTCKHCSESFDDLTLNQKANHSRWCSENPKRAEYAQQAGQHVRSLIRTRTGNQFTTGKQLGHRPETRDKIREHASKFRHSEETKQLIRDKALASGHRRLRRNPIGYRGILLDSSWERDLAELLDRLNIAWIRPDPLQWRDELGVLHHYYPDFFLPEYDIYLDPKNSYLQETTKDKLTRVVDQNNIRLYWMSKDQISEDFINQICARSSTD